MEKNNLNEAKEKVITVMDVIETVAGAVLMVFIFLAILSLIWTAWTLFQVSCTVIVFDLTAVALSWWADSLKKRMSK